MIKSFPKINKKMVKICVEKKKQFFKALYEATENGIEVIDKSEMIFSIKDNRDQSRFQPSSGDFPLFENKHRWRSVY